MSNRMVEAKYTPSIKDNIYTKGRNFTQGYVPAEIAMSMKEEENNIEVIGIIDYDVDNSVNEIQEYNRK